MDPGLDPVTMAFQLRMQQQLLATPLGRAVQPLTMAAGRAAMAGRWAESADVYATIVKRSHKEAGSFVMRSWAVKGLGSICFQQLAGRVPTAHVKLLKQISRDKFGDTLQLRCFAFRALGLISYDKGDRNGAAQFYRECISAADAAVADDLRGEICDGSQYVTSAFALDYERTTATTNLASLNPGATRQEAGAPPYNCQEAAAAATAEEFGGGGLSESQRAHMSSVRDNPALLRAQVLRTMEGEGMAHEGRTPTEEEIAMLVGLVKKNIDAALGTGDYDQMRCDTGPQSTSNLLYQPSSAAEALLLDRARMIHGDKCDECGKPGKSIGTGAENKDEAGADGGGTAGGAAEDAAGGGGVEVALQCCGKCKQRWFCSRVCQAKNWKEGHKKACRKRGTFKAGDRVVLINLMKRSELNGVMGTVGAKVNEGSGDGGGASEANGASGACAAVPTRWAVTTAPPAVLPGGCTAASGMQPETLSVKAANLMYLMA